MYRVQHVCLICGNDKNNELDTVVLVGCEGDAETFSTCKDTKACEQRSGVYCQHCGNHVADCVCNDPNPDQGA